jgi:hypothetical protein
MSDINIEAFFSDGEFAQKHIAGTVGFLRCRHLSKQVVATPVATKYFDSLDIHNNSNLFMFLNATRYYLWNKTYFFAFSSLKKTFSALIYKLNDLCEFSNS